jgi:anti-sigma factor RsiW
MPDHWTERLSDYLDGGLTDSEEAAVASHLEGCRACRETLAGLRRVVAEAGSLEDRSPSRDLWPGVARRIGAEPPRRRITVSVPQLLAAGVALAVLSGGGAWLLHPGAASVAAVPGDSAASSPAPAAAAGAVPVAASGATGRSYDSAVDDLERILAQGRGRLDSTTVRVLEQNLALIDRAIAQARRAVAADSANLYLNSHLAETMRRKIDLLRQAAALVVAVS